MAEWLPLKGTMSATGICIGKWQAKVAVIHWGLKPLSPTLPGFNSVPDTPRVCAVSYLNTLPLVWGALHGPQKGQCKLDFALPAGCADALAADTADIGIVPVAELLRLPLEIVPGLGIACFGQVRSILLAAKTALSQIRTLAADTSSRTSVQLARIILRERYGVEPEIRPHAPVLDEMLAVCDAALVIGDPALRIDPAASTVTMLDLGEEWRLLTGLPMVFAVWACQPWLDPLRYEELFRGSYEYGRARVDEIAAQEAALRGVSEELAREYLTRYIRFEIGEAEREGLRTFLQYAGGVREREKVKA